MRFGIDLGHTHRVIVNKVLNAHYPRLLLFGAAIVVMYLSSREVPTIKRVPGPIAIMN